MGNWERGSHAQSVYPRQDTSSNKTARVKQEEETYNNNSERDGRKKHGHKRGKSPKQGLTIELPEGRETHYHRLD